MKIAYLIAAHTDHIQLARLISSLYIKNITTFFVHIDKKANVDLFNGAIKKTKIKDVIFIKNRVSVSWGGYSQCNYQWNLISTCINFNVKFDRIFFLSGLDYPIWSNNKILNFLANNSTQEYIMGMNLTTCNNPSKMQTRVRNYHYRDFHFIRNKKIKRIIYGILREGLKTLKVIKNNYLIDNNGERRDIYCGSCWWCLTYKCLCHVYDVFQKDKNYSSYFKTALAPDELMIQTIVFNSIYAKKAILHEGVYPGLVGLTPLHYIEYDGYIPIWKEGDYNKLINSGKMFCRKLHTEASDKLLDMLDNYRRNQRT